MQVLTQQVHSQGDSITSLEKAYTMNSSKKEQLRRGMSMSREAFTGVALKKRMPIAHVTMVFLQPFPFY